MSEFEHLWSRGQGARLKLEAKTPDEFKKYCEKTGAVVAVEVGGKGKKDPANPLVSVLFADGQTVCAPGSRFVFVAT